MKNIKRILLATLATTTFLTGSAFATDVKNVAITAIVEHPALDAVRQGALAELKKEGFEEGKNLKVDFQSAQGNTATAAQIARKFVGDKPDVILAIGTPSAQAAAAATRHIPIVFSAITDPVAAKLVKSWQASGGNVTGASDTLPIQPQIDLIKKLIPNLKTIGFVYSSGEVNSTVVLKQLQEAGKTNGFTVIEAPAPRTTDISTAARSLKGRVDVIYTSPDNGIVSAYESLYKSALDAGIPLIAADTTTVARGAIAALSNNYYTLGEETGKIIASILKGEKPGNIPVKTMDKLDLLLNLKSAKAFGVQVPQELVDSAKEVIKE
ncbi:ABC transporter substrate-binding protein [Gallibacterium trehalosifermentans]|uniref:ABC transporter substrate-binding protein n=1 Tax=Gallibacterium trehalosifermentans TaxID=516935 RepID=A0ABV6GZ31_9PAST